MWAWCELSIALHSGCCQSRSEYGESEAENDIEIRKANSQAANALTLNRLLVFHLSKPIVFSSNRNGFIKQTIE